MTNHSVTTESTSKTTAKVDQIILRSTSTTRLTFRPTLVDNPHSHEASIHGEFIFQRKNRSANWTDRSDLKLSELKAEEWVKLELHSKELFKLVNELTSLYQLKAEHGIQFGKKTFFPGPKSAVLADLLEKEGELENLLKTEDLKVMNVFDLILGAAKLTQFLALFDANSSNPDEDFWHGLFRDNSWVLSQLFAYPMVIIDDKAYVGGKDLSNIGGNVVDFAYQNELTEAVALVEIKTPMSKLMAAAPYRPPNVYAPTSELAGATVQLLTSKSSLLAETHTLAGNTASGQVEIFNPDCLLLVGSTSDLTGDRLRSFELYRQGLKDVQVITFDELRRKVENLLTLLQSTSA